MSNLTNIELFQSDLRKAINAGHQHTREDILRLTGQMEAMRNNQREIVDNGLAILKFMEDYLTSLSQMLAEHDKINAEIIGGGNA